MGSSVEADGTFTLGGCESSKQVLNEVVVGFKFSGTVRVQEEDTFLVFVPSDILLSMLSDVAACFDRISDDVDLSNMEMLCPVPVNRKE